MRKKTRKGRKQRGGGKLSSVTEGATDLNDAPESSPLPNLGMDKLQNENVAEQDNAAAQDGGENQDASQSGGRKRKRGSKKRRKSSKKATKKRRKRRRR